MKPVKSLSYVFLDFTVLAFLVLILMLLFLSGCKHEPLVLPDALSDNGTTDPDTTFYQEISCDPDSVYFVNDILPLFISNCAKSGCHDAASHQEGIILDSYGNIMASGEILAGDPSEGDIIEVITENDPDKIMPRPPNDPLTQAQVDLITDWISQGALNNSCSGNCDTTQVTFSGAVLPALQTSCVGCHNNTTASGGVNLAGYSGVQIVAANGKLLGTINHAAGYPPMPMGGPKLPPCEIDKIRTWLNDGAPDN